MIEKIRKQSNMHPFKFIALVTSLAIVQNTLPQTTGDEVNKIMAGISNHGQTSHKEYLMPGDRSNVVGTQDGNFLI